jgi:hypothetical protein
MKKSVVIVTFLSRPYSPQQYLTLNERHQETTRKKISKKVEI